MRDQSGQKVHVMTPGCTDREEIISIREDAVLKHEHGRDAP
jgi:hypothetical protein